MVKIAILQIASYLFVLLLLVKPLGHYMACVYQGKISRSNRACNAIENKMYHLCGIAHEQEMNWKHYLYSMLMLNLVGFFVVYFIQRLQYYLPFNPEHFSAVSPLLAFNTAVSFVSNTNWQAYSGESTLSYFTQMMALTVQNFLSAATGMSLLVALIRGFSRQETNNLGNFWVDTFRSILYILLPLSLIFAVILTSLGVIQNLKPYQNVSLLQTLSYSEPTADFSNTTRKTLSEQIIPMGPVASQVAIKQLGTNGGGFFNTNSAHPFENPNPLTNFLEMLAILLIPAALCYTFGVMVNDKKQGWSILAAMYLIFIPYVAFTVFAEQQGNPTFTSLGIDQSKSGNMEGKETRFGVTNSALWATATTAASNGSVNSMLGSFTPLGGLVLLWMMHLGEVVFGGVGSGLYGMLMVVILTVFIAGLMVGRTPEYLGKKIEPFEIQMASFAILVIPLLILLLAAIAVVTPMGTHAITSTGAHGFSEILYAFTSMGNNNGSAFAGLNANTPFYNIAGGSVMLIARYWIAITVLALAGSLARKKIITGGSGTLATHTPLFIAILVSVTLILGALSFLPALALGPIVEHLILRGTA